MKKFSLSTLLRPRAVVVQLTLALVVQWAVASKAQAEYLQKTFCATFDDGTVMTGTFAGDPGDDGILTFNFYAYLFENEAQELEHFTLQIFKPGPFIGPGFWNYEFTNLGDRAFSGNLLNRFTFDPHAQTLSFLSLDFVTVRFGLAYNDPLRPLSYDDGFDTVFPSGVTVTIADAEDGGAFEWMEAHIAAGLAVGLIDNEGTARSLSSMVRAAGAALDRGNTDTTLRILEAFIHRLEIQYGKQLAPLMVQILAYDAYELISVVTE